MSLLTSLCHELFFKAQAAVQSMHVDEMQWNKRINKIGEISWHHYWMIYATNFGGSLKLSPFISLKRSDFWRPYM